MKDYLDTLISFIPYSETFHPSTMEETEDINYQSPLTDELFDEPSQFKPSYRQESQPVIVKSEYRDEEIDRVLSIDDNSSLLDLRIKPKK